MRAIPADNPTADGPGTADGVETGWAKVRIDARDWGRVLSVGRLSPRVVACKLFFFCPVSPSDYWIRMLMSRFY